MTNEPWRHRAFGGVPVAGAQPAGRGRRRTIVGFGVVVVGPGVGAAVVGARGAVPTVHRSRRSAVRTSRYWGIPDRRPNVYYPIYLIANLMN